MSGRTTKPRLGFAVMGAILFVQFALVISTPKNVSWDPSYGLLAAQQRLSGVSPSIFTLVEVDAAQITQVSAQPVSWWAPGYQAIPYALRFDTFNWGVALNLTLGVVLVIGSIGWFIYFAQVLGSAGLALWLSAAVGLTRFRWTMVLTYDGGDQLIWGASPWVLITAAAALRLTQKGASTRAAVLSGLSGAMGASLFALKYSGIFVAIGVGAVFSMICLRHRYWMTILLAGASFLGVILILGPPQGPNPANTLDPEMAGILRALAGFGLPAIGVTDLDRLLGVVLAKTSLSGASALIGTGLSLGILFGVVAYVRGNSRPLIRGDRVLIELAIGGVIVDFLILFLLNLKGANVGLAARFGRVSGFLLLPLLVAVWQGMLHENRSIWRAFAALGILAILILPMLLGTARQLPNIIDRLDHGASVTDVDGIVNVHLTPGTDVHAFYAEVESTAPNSVLYTIYPQMAFPLARRPLILVEAEELETPATLSKRRYYGRPADGVALLLPVTFEHNGKLEAIQASFVDIPQFVRHELPVDPKWALWVGS